MRKPLTHRTLPQHAFKKGERVWVDFNNKRYKATIHSVEANGKYEVRYGRGYSESGVEAGRIVCANSCWAESQKGAKKPRASSPVGVEDILVEEHDSPEALEVHLSTFMSTVSPKTPLKIHAETKDGGIQNWAEILMRGRFGNGGHIPPVRYLNRNKEQPVTMVTRGAPRHAQQSDNVPYFLWQLLRCPPHALDFQHTSYSKSLEHHHIKRGFDVMMIHAVCECLTNHPDVQEYRVLVYDDAIPMTTMQMFRYVSNEYPHLLSRIHIVITHVSDTKDTPESWAQTVSNVREIRRHLRKEVYVGKVTVKAMMSEKYLQTNTVHAAYIDGVQLFANQRNVLSHLLEGHNQSHNLPLIVGMTASMRGKAKGYASVSYAGIQQFHEHVTKSHHVQEFLPVRYESRDEHGQGGASMWTTFAVLRPVVHLLDD